MRKLLAISLLAICLSPLALVKGGEVGFPGAVPTPTPTPEPENPFNNGSGTSSIPLIIEIVLASIYLP